MALPSRFLRTLLGVVLAMGLGLEAAGPASFQEVGHPFIRNYAQKEYQGDFQNWGITQDPRGVVYVANNQGVLEYDGARWRLIPTPRRNVVRSVGVDGSGRVFVGSVGEIGYLEPGPNGASR